MLLKHLITFKNKFEYNTQALPFCYAGLFGYTGYDIVNYAEDIRLNTNHKSLDIPELLYHVYGIILVFNHTTNTLHVISHHYTERHKAKQQLQEVSEKIQLSGVTEFSFDHQWTTSPITDEHYKHLVAKAKEHCQQGDVFQLVLSRKIFAIICG